MILVSEFKVIEKRSTLSDNPKYLLNITLRCYYEFILYLSKKRRERIIWKQLSCYHNCG